MIEYISFTDMSTSTSISSMAATPAATKVNNDDRAGYNSNRTYKYTAEEMTLLEVGRQRYIKRKREEEEENMRMRIEMEMERPQKRSRWEGTIHNRNIKPSHVKSKNSTGKGRMISMSKENDRDPVPRTQRQQLSIQLALLADKLEPSPVETFAAFLNSSQACLRSTSPPPIENTRPLVRSSRDSLPGSSAQPQARERRAVSLSSFEPRESSTNNTTLSRTTQDLPRNPSPGSKAIASRVPRSSIAQLHTISPTPTHTHTPLESCLDIFMIRRKPLQKSIFPICRTTRERNNLMGEVNKIIARHENLTLSQSRPRTPMGYLTESQQMPSPPDSAEGFKQQPTYSKSNTVVSKLAAKFGSIATPATSQKSSSSNSFEFASSSNMLQDTSSVFALTPTHPGRVTAVNPSILQDADIENEHINGDEPVDFGSLFPQERGETASLPQPKENITARFSRSSLPSRAPEVSSVSVESHTLASTSILKSTTPTIPSTRPERRKSTRISTSTLMYSTENTKSSPRNNTKTKPKPKPKPKLPSPRLSPSPDRDDSSQFVPLKVHASRPAPDGLQLLVEWEDYPLEEDFTWELESVLASSVPEFVKAWWLLESKAHEEGGENALVKREKSVEKGKKTVEKKAVEKYEGEEEAVYLVEKILDKRNFKSVLHYLVKWVGYEGVNGRTWEPAESLGKYVPDLIEGFETRRAERKKGSGKGKGVGRAREWEGQGSGKGKGVGRAREWKG